MTLDLCRETVGGGGCVILATIVQTDVDGRHGCEAVITALENPFRHRLDILDVRVGRKTIQVAPRRCFSEFNRTDGIHHRVKLRPILQVPQDWSMARRRWRASLPSYSLGGRGSRCHYSTSLLPSRPGQCTANP